MFNIKKMQKLSVILGLSLCTKISFAHNDGGDCNASNTNDALACLFIYSSSSVLATLPQLLVISSDGSSNNSEHRRHFDRRLAEAAAQHQTLTLRAKPCENGCSVPEKLRTYYQLASVEVNNSPENLNMDVLILKNRWQNQTQMIVNVGDDGAGFALNNGAQLVAYLPRPEIADSFYEKPKS